MKREQMLRVCCVCNKVEQDNRWAADYSYTGKERVTHGYCPSCYVVAMAEIAVFIEQKHGLEHRVGRLAHSRKSAEACA